MPETLPYRPCVGIMLLNKQGRVWVGKRIPKWEKDFSAHLWQMPQGGIDKGENEAEAALRELKEETGITNCEIIDRSEKWLTYDLPPEAVGIALKGKYRGQKQKWFAMRFNGEDAEINIDPQYGEKPEFSEWKWADMDSLPEIVVPFKKDIYIQVVSQFSHLTSR